MRGVLLVLVLVFSLSPQASTEELTLVLGPTADGRDRMLNRSRDEGATIRMDMGGSGPRDPRAANARCGTLFLGRAAYAFCVRLSSGGSAIFFDANQDGNSMNDQARISLQREVGANRYLVKEVNWDFLVGGQELKFTAPLVAVPDGFNFYTTQVFSAAVEALPGAASLEWFPDAPPGFVVLPATRAFPLVVAGEAALEAGPVSIRKGKVVATVEPAAAPLARVQVPSELARVELEKGAAPVALCLPRDNIFSCLSSGYDSARLYFDKETSEGKWEVVTGSRNFAFEPGGALPGPGPVTAGIKVEPIGVIAVGFRFMPELATPIGPADLFLNGQPPSVGLEVLSADGKVIHSEPFKVDGTYHKALEWQVPKEHVGKELTARLVVSGCPFDLVVVSSPFTAR